MKLTISTYILLLVTAVLIVLGAVMKNAWFVLFSFLPIAAGLILIIYSKYFRR